MSLFDFVPEEERHKYAPVEITKKICVYCRKEKAIYEFPKSEYYHGGHDHRCKQCRRERSRDVRNLKKSGNIPPKPDNCECCNRNVRDENLRLSEGHKKFDLCCDHDPITGAFRGWLCSLCNRSLGGLGDTIESLTKALNYLKNAKKNERKTKRKVNIE